MEPKSKRKNRRDIKISNINLIAKKISFIFSISTITVTLLLIPYHNLKSQTEDEKNISQKKVYHPDEIERFNVVLLFESPPSYNEIIQKAASVGLDKALELLPFTKQKKEEIKRKKINPSDFVKKFSIDGRSEKPEGVEISASLKFDMKRLIRVISNEEPEPKYSIDCSYIEPIIKSVLEEFQSSANIKCEFNEKKGDFIQPSYLELKIKGEISNKGKMERLDFSKAFFFFSTPPYDKIKEEIKNYISSKFSKTKKIEEQRISLVAKKDKLNEIISSLRKKAFVYSVIPFYVFREGEKIKSEIVIRYFSDIPQETILSMTKDIVSKSGGEIVE
jgi:hypothetical protein